MTTPDPAAEEAEEEQEQEPDRQPAGQRYPRVYRAVSGGVQPVQTGSGILLGVVGYALLLNWIRGGPAQAKGWILAKLINKPYANANKPNTRPGEPRGTQ